MKRILAPYGRRRLPGFTEIDFWFCGQKEPSRGWQRIARGSPYPVKRYSIIAHASVYRSALIGRGHPGNQSPVILIEPLKETLPMRDDQKEQLISELRDLGARNPLTQSIGEILIRDRPLPVDIRHNSKIFRERLAAELNGTA